MYDFRIEAASKPAFYDELIAAAVSLTSGEPDPIANMANVAALLFDAMPELNWAGFYRNLGGELVLGPFQGKAACIRIPFGKGVCGTAAASRAVQLVEDVFAFPGHIACDAASRSELVVPILAGEALVGVLDLDSPRSGRFDKEDREGCVRLVQAISGALGGMEKGVSGA
jgi:L-methionine (R)-S-oxide reductase